MGQIAVVIGAGGETVEYIDSGFATAAGGGSCVAGIGGRGGGRTHCSARKGIGALRGAECGVEVVDRLAEVEVEDTWK